MATPERANPLAETTEAGLPECLVETVAEYRSNGEETPPPQSSRRCERKEKAIGMMKKRGGREVEWVTSRRVGDWSRYADANLANQRR